MDIILTHVGTQLPGYVYECVRQLRLFNPDNRVYLVTDKKNFPASRPLEEEFAVKLAPAEAYVDKRTAIIRQSGGVEALKRFIKRNFLGRTDADFWINTTTRLFYLENFARAEGIGEFCHFENDIMIYFAIDSSIDAFRKYRSIAITAGSPNQVMTGFAYFRSWESLKSLNDYIINSYDTDYSVEIKRKYDCPIMSEMMLMRAFADEVGHDGMEFLPILPYGDFSKGVEEFSAVFDPSSYGQFMGGTFHGEASGYADSHYYIGRVLKEHPEYCVEWHLDNGLKVPYLNFGSSSVRINNLHIHTKKLVDFRSA